MSIPKIALFTNIIAPYRLPCFNKVAEAATFKLDVFFFARTERGRQWRVPEKEIRFNYRILKTFPVHLNGETTVYLGCDILPHLVKGKYDLIVLGGYDQPLLFLTLLYSKLVNRKTLLWAESTLNDRRSGTWAYEKLKRVMVRNCSGFLVPGTASSEYLKSLGAPPHKVFTVPNAVDSEYYRGEYLRLKHTRGEIKAKKHYPPIVFLFSGRLIRKKGVLSLLTAYEKLQAERENIGLVLIGDGRERTLYEGYCKSHAVRNVFFEGFINREQLPHYYAAADIFILPSLSDPWGLVINEAMAFALPLIATDAAGATYDLLVEGVNGFVVKSGNSEQLYRAMKRLVDYPHLREKMGKESLSIIQNYTPAIWAENFINAIEETIRH